MVQYRCQYGTEQWLVKWKGYGEDRKTWEPMEHLGAEVQAEAWRVRTAALPRDKGGLAKMVMVTLKASLEECGLLTTGQKAALVNRLLEALEREDSAATNVSEQ